VGQRSKVLITVLTVLLSVGPASAWEQDLSLFSRVANSKEWLRLLHYRAPLLRSARSDVVSPQFFLDPEGRRDPKRELEATVRTALEGKSAICAFPARLAFLKRELGPEFVKALSAVACPDFEEWRKAIAAKAVSLVYSSAYPNNPASMFGHTFLRLDRRAGDEESLTRQMDFFSYGVNFSASVPDKENPVKYALWGLLGGYEGRYDLAPYYRKVNEYAYSESRDLWEYRLKMSEEETEQLVRHLWELYSGGFFTYYFLDENCSFQILTALEAVKPEWDLSQGFILSAIPIETVKRLSENPGMIESVRLRPSLRTQRVRAEALLTPSEQTRLRTLFRGESEVTEGDTAPVLDTLIAAMSYEKEMGGGDSRSAFMKSILLARSRLGPSTSARSEKAVDLEDEKRPDLSHGTSRLTLTGGRRLMRVSVSAFEHDFLNRSHSFNAFSEVRVLKLEAEKKEDSSFKLREARVLEMASFAPYSVFDSQKSWRVAISWSDDLWKTFGGYGLGTSFLSRRNLAYGLAAGELATGSRLAKAFRFSPGAEIGFLVNPVADRYFLHLRARSLYELTENSPQRHRWELEFLQAYAFAQNWDIRLGISRKMLESDDISTIETLSLSWMF